MTDEVMPCEVLIVGGGPAGATAAALLAEQGRQVVGSGTRFVFRMNLGYLRRTGRFELDLEALDALRSEAASSSHRITRPCSTSCCWFRACRASPAS